MSKFRKVTVALSCSVGLIVLITLLSQFSWFPRAINVQSAEQATAAAELDKTKVSPLFQSGSYLLQGDKGKIGLLVPGNLGSPDGYKIKGAK